MVKRTVGGLALGEAELGIETGEPHSQLLYAQQSLERGVQGRLREDHGAIDNGHTPLFTIRSVP